MLLLTRKLTMESDLGEKHTNRLAAVGPVLFRTGQQVQVFFSDKAY